MSRHKISPRSPKKLLLFPCHRQSYFTLPSWSWNKSSGVRTTAVLELENASSGIGRAVELEQHQWSWSGVVTSAVELEQQNGSWNESSRFGDLEHQQWSCNNSSSWVGTTAAAVQPLSWNESSAVGTRAVQLERQQHWSWNDSNIGVGTTAVELEQQQKWSWNESSGGVGTKAAVELERQQQWS